MELAASGGGGGSLLPLLLIAGLFAITYFMIIRPNSKRRRQMAEMQSSAAPGAQVVTIGGLHGTIVEVDDETVQIEATPGVVLRFARGAVAKVIEPAPSLAADDETTEVTESETSTTSKDND
jgi:preprotein translocase subunit YajC